ncbi:MAG: hypothetical protein A6F70_03375 [Cycloclasticus sp. symbiont of Bathymodiolus heckerae]|nr:MAG: hypothetical protein A6F70_03375 [Cycloclasticus sp. symbiont of Bathymodiolus heckerae]
MRKIIVAVTFLLTMSFSVTTLAEQPGHKPVKSVHKTSGGKPHKKMKRPQIEGVFSLDMVVNKGRIHLLAGRQKADKKSLWYRYSDDGGASWSVDSQVLKKDSLPVRATRGNDAQIVAQGEIVVVTWTKFDPKTRFNSGPMLAARSVDGGQSWLPASAPPDWNGGSHGFIDMAVDDKFVHAVWLDSRKAEGFKKQQGVRYSRSSDGGLSWDKNLTLDGHSCSCCWNKVVTDGSSAYVLYRDKNPSDLSIGVVNEQQQWQYLNHVGSFNWMFDGCPHIGGGLDFQTVLGVKRLHATVGTAHPKHLGVHYLYSNDSGKSWSDIKTLGDESAIHSDIAAHEDGRVIAVWDMMGEVGLGNFYAESKDGGEHWSVAKLLSTKGARASHPRIVKTKNGFFAAWTESDGLNQRLMTKGL